MSINVNDKNLGHATAYAYYKAGGGTMTEAEFTEFMADFGTASQTAVEAAQAALASKNAAQTAATTATNKATEATTAATTATTKAGEASTSASTATSAKDTAVSAASTATTKATEATTAAATATSAATTATTAKDDAVSAKTAAQTAQTGAETAAASVQSSAEQIATNAEDISQLKSELTAVGLVWHDGYIGSTGIIQSADNRSYSDLVVCPEGTVCKYVGDTSNVYICSIAWYDKFGNFISGVTSTSTLGEERTETAPTGCCFCRLTARNTILADSYLYVQSNTVAETAKNIYVNAQSMYNKHLIKKDIGTAKNYELTSSAVLPSPDGQPRRITICFPVVQGVEYTVDKKYRTNYYRIGYASNDPVGNTPISGYAVLSSNFNYITFVAQQTGYACMKVYDESTDTYATYEQVFNAVVAYEGNYNDTVTQSNEKVVNLDGGVFYCGANRTLKTLKAGIEEATKYMDATLYVDPGTYDLVEEFGQEYFDNATTTSYGLILKNRVHIVFSPNSKVISHYNGNNQYAHSIYSPFNAGRFGFTLENLNLQCSNCRYAVHDELISSPDQYKSEYVNCKMSIDNSQNTDWPAHHSIGGGLGANGEIVIKNCIFSSDDGAQRWGVSYHIPSVTSVTSYRSTILIENCYFETGSITLQTVNDMPESTSDNSEYMIVGNSFPTKYSGTDAQGIYNTLTHSANVREWNNVIRDAVA